MLSAGRYLLIVPALIFGVMHMMNASEMASMVPIPGGVVWVYITGLAMIAAAVAVVIGKYDKLAAALLGLLILIYALTIHLPGVLKAGDDAQMMAMYMGNFLKDVGLAGGAWVYAAVMAKDKSVIG
ncbi:MAG: DoxX family protein [Lewinellaceae bacterium]|nr:DoxX family protein [Lewinellaceae bacterium]